MAIQGNCNLAPGQQYGPGTFGSFVGVVLFWLMASLVAGTYVADVEADTKIAEPTRIVFAVVCTDAE